MIFCGSCTKGSEPLNWELVIENLLLVIGAVGEGAARDMRGRMCSPRNEVPLKIVAVYLKDLGGGRRVVRKEECKMNRFMLIIP